MEFLPKFPGRLTFLTFDDGSFDDRLDEEGNERFFAEYHIPDVSLQLVIEEVANETQRQLQAAKEQGVNDIEIFPDGTVVRFRERE